MFVKDYDRGLSWPRIVYVLWSPQSGPICAYDEPTLAFGHAGTMLGVTVSSTELRTELPEIALSAVEAEYDETTQILIEDIDDGDDT